MKSVNRLLISMSNKFFDEIFSFMCGSCHIRNVLIGVEYQNCRPMLDVYLLFSILMGQIPSKIINLWTGQFVNYKSVI